MWDGSFHSWINVWVAGKTVWSPCHSARLSLTPLVTVRWVQALDRLRFHDWLCGSVYEIADTRRTDYFALRTRQPLSRWLQCSLLLLALTGLLCCAITRSFTATTVVDNMLHIHRRAHVYKVFWSPCFYVCLFVCYQQMPISYVWLYIVYCFFSVILCVWMILYGWGFLHRG